MNRNRIPRGIQIHDTTNLYIPLAQATNKGLYCNIKYNPSVDEGLANYKYSCYIEECKEKFMNPDERLDHCVKVHKLPRDFRFDQRPKATKCNKKNKSDMSMELDVESKPLQQKFVFSNSKQKAFVKTGKKNIRKSDESNEMNIEMLDVKENVQT